eukprot:SM000172S03066  [mRNA]  locus=s172:167050:167850:- [translate_table: standard]
MEVASDGGGGGEELPELLRLLRVQMPVQMTTLELRGPPAGPSSSSAAATADVGLVIVDEVHGFCTVGAGNLAPSAPDAQIAAMVAETAALASAFAARRWPALAFLDTHAADRPEPPWPPHCVVGTGEENLVQELAWLESCPSATLVRKDCVDGFVGAMRADGSNAVVDWVRRHRLRRVLVTGICTDVCVLAFVVSALSARNHGLLPGLEDVVVHAGACATADLPADVAAAAGPGAGFAHPQAAAHHVGLYVMQAHGAQIVDSVIFA